MDEANLKPRLVRACAGCDRKIAAVMGCIADGCKRCRKGVPVNLHLERRWLPASQMLEPRIPERHFTDAPLQTRAHAPHDGGIQSHPGHEKKVAPFTCALVYGAADVNGALPTALRPAAPCVRI